MTTRTAQKMKFSIKDFFSKCDQIRSFLRIWSHSLKKSLMGNFIFCAVSWGNTSFHFDNHLAPFHLWYREIVPKYEKYCKCFFLDWEFNYRNKAFLIWSSPALREKCPDTEFFLVHIFLHSDWIRRFTGPYLDTFHLVMIVNQWKQPKQI